jgi:hypothetical protein
MRPDVDRVKARLDVAAKAMAVFWWIASFFGGLVFLVYFSSIGFMPEIDLEASLFLIAAALTAGFLLIWLAVFILLPGLFFGLQMKSENFSAKGIMKWFFLPLFVLMAFLCALIKLDVSDKLSTTISFVIVYVLVILLTSLLREMATHSWRKAGKFCFNLAFSALSLVMLFYLQAHVPSNTEWHSYLAIFLALVINSVYAFAPSSPGRRWLGLPLLYMALTVMLLFLVTLYFGPTLIPNAVMHLYKFGHFKAASLVLKDEGCAIARDHGLQEGAPCHFADVMICSRLGSTYYVEVRKASTPARFTIPAQDVLSWGVADEQLPEAGCKSTKKP